MAQLVKNLPVIRETWVQSLGWEDPLGKGAAPTVGFWPGEFPWGRKELDTTAVRHVYLTVYLTVILNKKIHKTD